MLEDGDCSVDGGREQMPAVQGMCILHFGGGDGIGGFVQVCIGKGVLRCRMEGYHVASE